MGRGGLHCLLVVLDSSYALSLCIALVNSRRVLLVTWGSGEIRNSLGTTQWLLYSHCFGAVSSQSCSRVESLGVVKMEECWKASTLPGWEWGWGWDGMGWDGNVLLVTGL